MPLGAVLAEPAALAGTGAVADAAAADADDDADSALAGVEAAAAGSFFSCELASTAATGADEAGVDSALAALAGAALVGIVDGSADARLQEPIAIHDDVASKRAPFQKRVDGRLPNDFSEPVRVKT